MPPVIAAVASIGAAIGAASAAVVGALGLTSVVAALGVSAFTFLATGLSIGYSLLRGGGKAPANSSENANRLRANIDPRTPRKTMVGISAMATDIRDEEFTDSQSYFHRFIVVASHKVHEITEIWFDDKIAWSLAGGVQGEFAGYLTVTPILEGNAGNAINISARMGSTRRYTGCAYVHLRYKLTGNDKSTDSPFAQSITTRITIRGKGAYVYDPRLDSTVPGGSGAHRADDQSTWAWSDDACRNPALVLLFYLLGWKIAGLPAVGKGIPPARIDLESFAIAANICDESVAKAGGGTEPRYRCDGVWSEGDAPTTVIDMLKACMNADLDDVDGKLRLTVFHNDLASVAAAFTTADVLGAFKWNPVVPLEQNMNIVRGTYTDPSNVSLYQQVDYPQVAVASADGIDRIDTFNQPMVESPGQAQRLANLRRLRRVYGGAFEADFQATAWAVQKNSVVSLTFAPLGFVNKLFRVAEMELRVDGVVPLILREENAAIYAAPTLATAISAVASTPYNASLNPIIGAIDTVTSAADQTLILNSWQDFGVSITGTTTTITINDHDRVYSDKTLALTGVTITGLTDATAYYLYYDDAARSDTTPTFAVTTDYQDVINSPAHPARHYAGVITTGAAATGYPVLPPGSYDYVP